MKKKSWILKKIKIKTISKIPRHLPTDRVDIWFQDEARIGQQNTTTRMWAPKGTRPDAIKQQQFEYAHIYGAICATNGKTEALITPNLSKKIMRDHLQLISDATEKGRHAVVIMDGAGWHIESMELAFDNLSIIKLPPYSPQLNPIEKVWSWLRQHHLANRCFSGYENIVDSISDAWNDFRSIEKRVKDISHMSWLNQAIYLS
jgi:transposase